jgi:hypothetical protein
LASSALALTARTPRERRANAPSSRRRLTRLRVAVVATARVAHRARVCALTGVLADVEASTHDRIASRAAASGAHDEFG